MDKTPFGTTVFEQVPEEFGGASDTKSPWALGIILVVALLFGAFWFYQRNISTTPVSNPVPATPSPDTTESQRSADISVEDLQTAAVNIAIPDFSQDF